MYAQTTRSISVSVRPVYLRDHSAPEDNHFVWAYRIRLANQGQETVQLLNRYWRIEDEDGRVQEVRGPGVVGEHPVLQPGDDYEYGSFTHLPTATGHMQGVYEMRTSSGERFEVTIPRFDLAIACRLVVSN